MRTTPVPRFLTALVAVTRRFVDDQGFLLAAALSFSFLLCLAPLTLLLFAAAGFILESNAIAEYVLDSASYLLPGLRARGAPGYRASDARARRHGRTRRRRSDDLRESTFFATEVTVYLESRTRSEPRFQTSAGS